MTAKKNITIATLAALLAVPALGTTNINIHADSTTTVTSHLTKPFDGYPAGTPVYDGHGGNAQPNTERGVIGHPYNDGHQMVIIPDDDLSTDAIHTNNQNAVNDNNANSNDSTQYSNNQNALPQTGESNNSKAMTMGAVTLGVSLMALAIAKKHKQEANLETVTPAEPAVNGGKDNNKSHANKNSYNMIMGETFKDISNGFNNL